MCYRNTFLLFLTIAFIDKLHFRLNGIMHKYDLIYGSIAMLMGSSPRFSVGIYSFEFEGAAAWQSWLLHPSFILEIWFQTLV